MLLLRKYMWGVSNHDHVSYTEDLGQNIGALFYFVHDYYHYCNFYYYMGIS